VKLSLASDSRIILDFSHEQPDPTVSQNRPTLITINRHAKLTYLKLECDADRRVLSVAADIFVPHAVNCIRFCFGSSEIFLFVYEISREPLNDFAPISQRRRVWSLCRRSLNVKVKGQGHQEQIRHFGPFRRPACGLCFVKHL